MINSLLPIEDPKPKAGRLSFDQIKEWNQFMQGDPKGSLDMLYAQYKKTNPKGTIPYDSLQNEMELLTQNSRALSARKGQGDVAGNTNTGFRFPDTEMNGRNYGPMNGDMQSATALPKPQPIRPVNYTEDIPSGVNDLSLASNGYAYYEDPHSGDIVYTNPDFIHLQRFRKKGLTNSLIPQ